LGISPDFNPILHKLAVLGFMALEVGLITPFDMARKRLQVQKFRRQFAVAGEAHQPFKASVEMAPKIYTGIWNVIHSVVAEESCGTGRRNRKGRKRTRAASTSADTTAFGAGDWQDLYDPVGSPQTRRNKRAGAISRLGRFWSGVQSLYRGYWARYATTVVSYAFSEMREKDIF
jgi:hypothetical protein